MPACRQSYNLFTKLGRRNYFSGEHRRQAREEAIRDTFRFLLRGICKVIGHGRRVLTDWENGKRYELCTRCLGYTGKVECYEKTF